MQLIDDAINYYKANRKSFIEQYNGKYLVIRGRKLLGVYKTHTEAFDTTIKDHEVGTFIIEHPIALKSV